MGCVRCYSLGVRSQRTLLSRAWPLDSKPDGVLVMVMVIRTMRVSVLVNAGAKPEC
jgi:hypothetical protein